ncbi:hypothetical protein AAFF_G00173090 [Aldrovandia affinis]|uniref:Peptidase S72 domain-containing protein n=1 Tax=Aldrovandia affinis TaxID=143900 RepID=A0AAD7SZN7_9TELE|nr:hypothetical protein AAFF_G00173090 [Aldrovandia affinis]
MPMSPISCPLLLMLLSSATQVWASETPSSCPSVSVLHDLPDRAVRAGTAFFLPLPPKAFQGPVRHYQVSLADDASTLPTWLVYSAQTGTLQGLALREEGGEYALRVTAVGRGRYLGCPVHETATMAALVIHMDAVRLGGAQRFRLVTALADYLHTPPTSITLLSFRDALSMRRENTTILVSGYAAASGPGANGGVWTAGDGPRRRSCGPWAAGISGCWPTWSRCCSTAWTRAPLRPAGGAGRGLEGAPPWDGRPQGQEATPPLPDAHPNADDPAPESGPGVSSQASARGTRDDDLADWTSADLCNPTLSPGVFYDIITTDRTGDLRDLTLSPGVFYEVIFKNLLGPRGREGKPAHSGALPCGRISLGSRVLGRAGPGSPAAPRSAARLGPAVLPQQLLLVARDSAGLTARLPFVIELSRAPREPCHAFTLTARNSLHSFLRERRRIQRFLEKLARFFNDSSDNLALLSLDAGSTVVVWYNVTLCRPGSRAEGRCPERQIQSVWARMRTEDGRVDPAFSEAMLPEFPITEVGELTFGGVCLPSTPTPAPTVLPPSRSDLYPWTAGLLIALLVVCGVFLLAVLTLALLRSCKRCRTLSLRPSQVYPTRPPERRALKPRLPPLFQDEVPPPPLRLWFNLTPLPQEVPVAMTPAHTNRQQRGVPTQPPPPYQLPPPYSPNSHNYEDKPHKTPDSKYRL